MSAFLFMGRSKHLSLLKVLPWYVPELYRAIILHFSVLNSIRVHLKKQLRWLMADGHNALTWQVTFFALLPFWCSCDELIVVPVCHALWFTLTELSSLNVSREETEECVHSCLYFYHRGQWSKEQVRLTYCN